VRHAIVHNKYVVEGLRAKGAIFVEELDEIPEEHRQQPVVFSAHGVPKSVPADAMARNLFYLDATCPLVSKVHKQAMRHQRLGRHVVLIGHAGHPEVIGTMGQLPAGQVLLVEDVEQARTVEVSDSFNLAYATQTTLSVDDTIEIVAALRRRFPAIHGPKKEDICYATQNRQLAVKEISPTADLVIVVGSRNSSNSVRLVEVALEAGAKASYLVDDHTEIDEAWLDGVETVSVTSGASPAVPSTSSWPSWPISRMS
jgi:4-hydroxy-3-methylbut-2-enyl diphosphate reductase